MTIEDLEHFWADLAKEREKAKKTYPQITINAPDDNAYRELAERTFHGMGDPDYAA